MERVVAALGQAIGYLLDPALVGDSRPGVGLAPVALGRILARVAVYLIQALGLGVPRLEVVVAQRPGGREPVGMLDFAEVLRPQPVQRRAVQLGGPADEVVDLGLERLTVAVEPGVLGDVPALHEHRLRVPVVHLTREEVAAFEQQYPLARWRQRVSERASASAAADNDHVIVLTHQTIVEAAGLLGHHPLEVIAAGTAEGLND